MADYQLEIVTKNVYALAVWDSSWNSYSNCYILTDNSEVTLIDSGKAEHSPILLEALGQLQKSSDAVVTLVATHGHRDHVGGSVILKRAKKTIQLADFPLLSPDLGKQFSPDLPSRGVVQNLECVLEQVVMGDPELPGTILRLAAVYGPGDPLHRLFFFLKRMADNRPAILLDALEAKWRWARAYVENVAAAITLAVTDGRAAGRIFNVAEPEGPSRCEWVKSIARSARWTGRIVLVPEGRLPLQLQLGVKDPKQDLVLDTSRIRRELGYKEIVSPDEGLSQTVAWEREHPPENVDPQMFDYSTEDAILAKLELQGQT